jgi:hypothetical protein
MDRECIQSDRFFQDSIQEFDPAMHRKPKMRKDAAPHFFLGPVWPETCFSLAVYAMYSGKYDFPTKEVLSMSKSLLTFCAVTAMALTSTLRSDGQNQSPTPSASPKFVPIQSRKTTPHRNPEITHVPNPDPNGPNVRSQYPQQPGQPPLTDACFISLNPPAGCMYTPYAYPAGYPCGCTDGYQNYTGRFLLY